ncbi:MAG: hypothetical protein IJT62_09365 [Oscillospiraceae bacterium]|nr:hypothetical protein [Oscillospiraceae bacterium]
MKKIVLIILCLALLVLTVGGAAAYLSLTPRGVLRPSGPEEQLQRLIDSRSAEQWRQEYVACVSPAVTEFEDAARVAGDVFDAAVREGDFAFRTVPDSESEEAQDFIVSRGGVDFLACHGEYDGRRWQLRFSDPGTLVAETRSVSVLVPEDASVIVNGITAGPQYILRRDLPYPDMTELELRTEGAPRRVQYLIEGLYEVPEVTADRPGGLTLLRSDGESWEYTRPDAGAYAFTVTAPGTAVVTVNGTELAGTELKAVAAYPTRLTFPADFQSDVPFYSVYSVSGLYLPPEIAAAMPDGTPLTPETGENGALFYALPASDALYAEAHERVEDFLRLLCEYGAGHTWVDPWQYMAHGTDVNAYLYQAIDSLHWTVGVTTSYDEVSSSDYVPIGENAFLCRGHVNCTTRTGYQTVNLLLDYEMLWVRDRGAWMIMDLGFI